MERRSSRRRRRLLALCLALAPFLVAELALRLLGLEYPRFEFPIQVWNADEDVALADETALHRFDEYHLWLPREGAVVPWDPSERIPPMSYRGGDPDPAAGVKVLVLGDSSTFGWHVREEETYARLLERDLEAYLAPPGAAAASGRPVQVLNGGIIGSTIRQGLERYRRTAPLWRPDVVVGAFGTINDHVPTMDLDDAEKFDWLRRRRQPLARAVRFLRDHVRLLHLASWIHDQLRGGREAWLQAFVVSEAERRKALQDYRKLPDYKRRVSVAEFERCLDELGRAVRADGGRLVLLSMPRKRDTEEFLPQVLEYDEPLARVAAREGVPLVDARGAVRRRIAEGVAQDELFWDGTHPRASGHAIVAATLAPVVREELRRAGLGP